MMPLKDLSDGLTIHSLPYLYILLALRLHSFHAFMIPLTFRQGRGGGREGNYMSLSLDSTINNKFYSACLRAYKYDAPQTPVID